MSCGAAALSAASGRNTLQPGEKDRLLTRSVGNKHESRITSCIMADAPAEDWKHLGDDHHLSKFAADLGTIFADTGHNEMYGVVMHTPEEGYVCL